MRQLTAARRRHRSGATRIVFGEGSIARLNELVPANARAPAPLLQGGAERNGTLAEVTAALGARTKRLGGIEPNPTYETLMNAVEQVRRDDIDFLLAVGGGSHRRHQVRRCRGRLRGRAVGTIMETHGEHVENAPPIGC